MLLLVILDEQYPLHAHWDFQHNLTQVNLATLAGAARVRAQQQRWWSPRGTGAWAHRTPVKCSSRETKTLALQLKGKWGLGRNLQIQI